MCKCFEYFGGVYNLTSTDRGEIDLNLIDKQIEIDDYYDKKTYCLLEINYCPVCGEKL